MPKRQSKAETAVPQPKPPGPAAALRQALDKRKKAELVDALMELAEEDRKVLRGLSARFEVATPPAELIAATRQAIADATAFDTREINRNFDYDYQAYTQVKRNLDLLIGSGRLREAMTLALELMKKGSYQVEMSDEGMMTGDIEDALKGIIKALGKCDLRASEVIAWCSAMLESDRNGFIAQEPLQSLRKSIQARADR